MKPARPLSLRELATAIVCATVLGSGLGWLAGFALRTLQTRHYILLAIILTVIAATIVGRRKP